ncbi:hypothetical protein D3C86_1200520 [compost metagenome]
MEEDHAGGAQKIRQGRQQDPEEVLPALPRDAQADAHRRSQAHPRQGAHREEHARRRDHGASAEGHDAAAFA